MKQVRVWLCVLGLLSGLLFATCGQPVTPGNGDVADPGDGNVVDPGEPDAGDPTPPGGDGEDPPSDSVSDVTTGDGTDPGATPPVRGTVAARVRNESAFQADVTLRFIARELVAHLAFIRVLPDTVTTVVSPELADTLEASGFDERGQTLASKVLTFGIDFDESTPAEYVIPGDPADDSDPSDPPPDEDDLPTLILLEPADDTVLTLGSTLLVTWTDSSTSAGAVVRIWLRSVDAASELIPVGPAVDATMDGVNDELVITLEDIEPRVYEVIGMIDDGITQVTSVAPGRVQVEVDPGNVAPLLTILSPQELTEVHNGDVLLVTWSDEDEDSNALITFSLVESGSSGSGEEPFVISPPLEEDPDEPGADRALLTIPDDALLGLYDLLGTIYDGLAVGTARVEGVVLVVNDPPWLELTEPDGDIVVGFGESVRVAWTDSDGNDNALIDLWLDPHPAYGAPDRDEVLLLSSLEEDDPEDDVTLDIPGGVSRGTYRVKGEITDGVEAMVTWAQGIIYFGVAPADVSLVEPSTDVRTRVGETVPITVITTDPPAGAEVRFHLSNVAYDGSTEVDVTNLVQNAGTELTFPALAADMPIPNDAWPRRFDLQAELIVDGVVLASDVAPGLVWIRQEVEIVDVTVNYTCPGGDPISPGDRQAVGVTITWYGGGFEERDTHANVAFWLTGDGAIPPTGGIDNQHKMIHIAPESPRIERTAELVLRRIMAEAIREEDGLVVALESGFYWLRTVVDPEGFGSIMSEPYPDRVEVCAPRGTVPGTVASP